MIAAEAMACEADLHRPSSALLRCLRRNAAITVNSRCVLGGDSYSGLGWGRALLVYWRYLGGMCCVLMHVTGPGLMRMQRPGRRVPGCGSCRRVKLNAVVRGVVGLRWWADVSFLWR